MFFLSQLLLVLSAYILLLALHNNFSYLPPIHVYVELRTVGLLFRIVRNISHSAFSFAFSSIQSILYIYCM
jgi:hypothetical protein